MTCSINTAPNPDVLTCTDALMESGDTFSVHSHGVTTPANCAPRSALTSGMKLIGGAGLYTLWRETRLGRAVAAEPAGGAMEESR